MSSRAPNILQRVVEAARQVLADLDSDDVPSGLVRVATQTGRRLAPPYARRLIDEVDCDEWFRLQVEEAFEGSAEATDPYERAAALFLRRPEDWEDYLQEIRERLYSSERSDLVEWSKRRISELESELDTWRNSAKRYRREAEEAAAKSDRRVAAARAAGRAEVRSEEDLHRIGQMGRQNRRISQELARSQDALGVARRRLADTRAELERERRAVRESVPDPTPSAWADLDPLGAARLLDDVAEALMPESRFAEPDHEAAPADDPLGLPSGTPPDHRSAIEWMLGLERSFALLIDGYNVAHHVDRARFNHPEIRHRLENDLVRLKTMAKGRPRVMVVYDSRQPGETTTRSVVGGIEVRFTTAGHSADDELMDLADRLGSSAIVVSSDRRVRERAQESGSVGLWSEALAGWMLNR